MINKLLKSTIKKSKRRDVKMQNNLNNQKPVEFFSAERIKIEIDGQQILWRDMKLEIDSRIGKHTVGKIKYIGSVNQLSLYDALIDRKGDKEIKILGRSNIADDTGNSTEKIFLNGVVKELQINETTAGALTIEIIAISKSVLLDKIPRYRLFQDPTLTYLAIAEEINGNYGTNDGSLDNLEGRTYDEVVGELFEYLDKLGHKKEIDRQEFENFLDGIAFSEKPKIFKTLKWYI